MLLASCSSGADGGSAAPAGSSSSEVVGATRSTTSGAGATSSAAPTSTTRSAPAPTTPSTKPLTVPSGQPLTSLGSIGEFTSIFGNDRLIVARNEEDQLVSYTLDGDRLGSFSGPYYGGSSDTSGQSRLDVTADIEVVNDSSGTPHIYGIASKRNPPAGLAAATTDYSLVSFSASFEPEWEQLVATLADDLTPPPSSLAATDDGSAIVVGDYGYVTLDSKEVDTAPETLYHPMGNYVYRYPYQGSQVEVIEPASGQIVLAGELVNPAIDPQTPLERLYYYAAERDPLWTRFDFLDADHIVTRHGILSLTTGDLTPVTYPVVDHFSTGPVVDPISRTLVSTSGGLVGINADTGAESWSVESGALGCASLGGVALVTVDHQWVLIDAATGRQLDYQDNPAVCPRMFGPVGVTDTGEIYQIFSAAPATVTSATATG